MSRPRILQTRRWPEDAEKALAAHFEVTIDQEDKPLSNAELIETLRYHDGVAATVTDRFDATVFEAIRGSSLKIIANFGVGVNHIDLNAAKEAGIVVSNTPGVLTDATADIALTLMMMVMRRTGEGERELREGGWTGWRPTHLLGRDLSGKTLGIIGMGRIGKAIARRCAHAFGMKVVFYNRSQVNDMDDIGAIQLNAVADVCAAADIVSLHCPGGDDTRHILNEAAIAAMPEHGVVINTARGDVIDEDALAVALKAGAIGGAGLDVFQGEPNINPILMDAPNTVFLPHMGSGTIETRNAMGMMVVDNLRAYFEGKPVPNPAS